MARTDNFNNWATDVANSIRVKTGKTDKIAANQFDIEIENIKTDPVLQDKDLVITENGIINVTPDEGYDGLNNVDVTVNVTSSGDVYKIKDATDLFNHGYRVMEFNDIIPLLGEIISMYGMCSDTTKLTFPIDFRSLNTSKVTTAEDAFRGCFAPSINLNGLDFSSLKTARNMFSGCSNLTSVDLGNIKTSTNLTNIEHMFAACSNLTEIDISGFIRETTSSLNSTFLRCSKLTSMDLSIIKSKLNLYQTFYQCTSITEVDLSGATGTSSLFQTFYGCSKLKTINLSNMDTSNMASMNGTFTGCTSLELLDIRKFDFSGITTILNMFVNVPVNCKIIVKDDTVRNWILTNQRSDFTNVVTVAEL